MAKAKTEKPEKLFDDQFDDEEVMFVFRKHPIVMRRGLIFASIAILLGTVPALIKPEMSYFFGGLAAGFVLALIAFSPSWISWYYSIFIVTNQRLIQITRKGLFNKTVVDLGLSQIQSLNYEVRGMQATLLGFGTIMVQTYMGDLVVHEVHHPGQVVKKLAMILRDEGIEATTVPNQNTDKKEEETEQDA
jgi:uncharacterized integral membrane protein